MIKNKYHNKKITTADGKFDSKYEYEIWCRLKLLEKANKISQLQRQVPFELISTIKTNNETLRKIRYIADFVYIDENGKKIAMDSKGKPTEIYLLKKRLFILKYVKSGEWYFIEKYRNKEVVYKY